MGCDILFYVEARGANGKWESRDKIWKDSVGEFTLLAQFGDKAFRMHGDEPAHKYIDRDYFLFSILADMRNTDPKIPCIAEPRGIPDDLSNEVQAVFDTWGADGHSHSWLLLSEVLDWKQWDHVIEYKDTSWDKSGKVIRKQVTATLRKRCKSFWDNVLKPMSKLCQDPNNVRMVFFFDN